MPTPILLLSPLVLGQLVASAHGCPAASAIDARVREILGIRQNALEERAVVGREGATLRVTLRDKDDRVLGDRWVHAEGSCDELAGVAAVVLAAWLSDVHPEYLGSLPAPAAPVSLPSTPERAAVEASAEQPSPRRWLLGAALGADLSAASPAPLAALGVRWIPTGSGWGAAIGATIIGARSEELSAGSVRYWRWPLALGPAYRVPVGSAVLDAHAGAVLAWLHVEGHGFAPSKAHDALLGGGLVSTRLSMSTDRFTPFAEMTGVLWSPTAAFVQRGPDQPAVGLPGLELYVALGASWRAW